ncbi:hypothetical protein Droror1_Dr00026714, partial [Drosera rotundifolia]
ISLNAIYRNYTNPLVGKSDDSAASFGSRVEEMMNKTILEYPVVVYSKTWYSSEVKLLFKRLGVESFVVELDQLGEIVDEMERDTTLDSCPLAVEGVARMLREGGRIRKWEDSQSL